MELLPLFVAMETWILSTQMSNSQRNGVALCLTRCVNEQSADAAVVAIMSAQVTVIY
jgi:pseudouridine-5'-phosphate glycosidase